MSQEEHNDLDAAATADASLAVATPDATDDVRSSWTGIRVRNRRLVLAREKLGLDSAKAAARQLGLTYDVLVRYESRKLDPWGTDGTWKQSAVDIAEAYGLLPDELWPGTMRHVHETHAALTLAVLADPSLPDVGLEHDELRRELNRALHQVSWREEEVLRLRFGVGRAPILEVSEIAARYELSSARIHQLIKSGLEHVRKRLPEYAKDASVREVQVPPPGDADRVLQALGTGKPLLFSWLTQYQHLRPHALRAIWDGFLSGRSGVVLLERLVQTDACGLARHAEQALEGLRQWSPVTADDVRLYLRDLWCTLASLMQALGYADTNGAFYKGWDESYRMHRNPARGENRP